MNDRKEYYDPMSFLMGIYPALMLICAIPSMTVILFLRYRLGYRFVNPLAVGFAVLLFITLSSVGGLFGGGGISGSYQDGLMERYAVQFLFGVVMIALAIIHRRIGWKLIFDRQNPWHTKSRGLSHLSRILPLPVNMMQRFIEPLFCVLVGFLLMVAHLTFLGTWIAFAGITLAAMEQLVYEEAINAMLDPLDTQIEAREIKATNEMIKNGGQAESRPLQQSGGVRMNVSPEIRALLLRAAPE